MPILCTNPDYETATHWGSAWMEEILERAIELGWKFNQLYKDKAIKKVFIETIDESNPIYIFGVGHGNATTYTGYQGNHLLKVGDEESARIAKGRHFVLLSCRTGARLLPWLVEQGAVACQGYDEDFTFIIDKQNYPDSYATPFFLSHILGDIALLEGKTHKEAYDIVYNKFTEYINSPEVPEICKPYLLHDRDARVLFGDDKSRITEEVPPDTYDWVAELEPKEQPPPEKFNIRNIVKDKESGEPVSGAEIYIAIEGSEGKKLITDENGIAILEDTIPGTYVRNISHPKYEEHFSRKEFPPQSS